MMDRWVTRGLSSAIRNPVAGRANPTYNAVSSDARITKTTTVAGEIGSAGAEGATAPETLRHTNRRGRGLLWKVAHAPADGITFSGKQTEGAPQVGFVAV